MLCIHSKAWLATHVPLLLARMLGRSDYGSAHVCATQELKQSLESSNSATASGEEKIKDLYKQLKASRDELAVRFKGMVLGVFYVCTPNAMHVAVSHATSYLLIVAAL